MKREETALMGEEDKAPSECDTPDYSSTFVKPSMPPPPYFKTHFIDPSSYKAAIRNKLDNPIVSLFRLTVRLLQFAFALASGISYAVELNHGHSASNADFIYAQVVFGFTLLVLVFDSITVRSYRFTWIVEWTLAILWVACFGVFYNIYLHGEVDPDYAAVNLGRMERAVWCDFINALLWTGSATFSSIMCCSGIKAAVKSRLQKRRELRKKKMTVNKLEEMETGTVGAGQA
ncbi:hypothetical protein NX059_010808 [Plenodomus lindquistii]|nr:hypothetical protein NX059_010808 [Plenodomus lindquistii]